MIVTLPKVILVLRDTIAAKEQYLAGVEARLNCVPVRYDETAQAERLVDKATVGFLKLNIEELNMILKDLENVQP